FTLNPADLWSCRADTRLYKFLGIICSISTVTQYTQAARYYCTVTTCDGYTGQHFIRMHTPGASEFQTIRNDFVCIFCGSTLVEDASCRLLSDKIIVQMLSYDALNSNGCRHQAISVFLRGDLTSDIMIGKSYRVIGIPTYQHNESKISVAIEANNIYMDSKKLEQICNQGNCSITMPSSVLTLYDDRKSSSWSFVASLAYIFGGDITPPGTYFRLKLGMLLSLVETPKNNKQKSKVSRCLHVLAIGCDTLVIHRLLTFGASFCKRNIQHSASTSLFTSVTKDNHGTGACTIDGGSLLLAKNGICSLGDLSHYRKDTREKLLHVMENSSISVDIPRKFSDAAPQKQMVLPILCNIWAYTYPSTGNHKGIKGIFQNQDLGNIPNTFADTFGMVYVCDNPDTTRDDTAQQTLINQVLTAAVLDDKQQHTVQSIITYEDFKKVIID
ncbi:minichromosome maintenance domain-containing protein 2-like, partial [Saccoglossus kowalevskii]